MKRTESLIITGAFPDRLNSNVGIRHAIAVGFRKCLAAPDNAVTEVRFEYAVAAVAERRPDLVLLIGSSYPDLVRYEAIRAACDRVGSQLVFWMHDDPYEFDTNYRVCEVADCIFTSDRWAARHYSHPRVYHLPLAADPAVFQRPTDGRRSIDFFFCGIAFANRIALMRDLTPRIARYHTVVFGEGWPEDLVSMLPGCRNTRLEPAQFADYCAASRLTLNIGRHLDLANRRFQLPASTPGPRTFEAALAGAVQLVFVESLEVTEYFEPGEEILLFDSLDEIAPLLDTLRRDSALVRRIAAAGQRRALTEHTYAHRARQLLRWVDEGR